jgi:hypothetical protein
LPTSSVLYFTQFILAIISCFSTKEEREAYRLRREEKKEEQAAEERALREYDEILKSPTFGMPMTPASGFPGMTPMTPGSGFPGMHPMTPGSGYPGMHPMTPRSGFPGMYPMPVSPHSPMMGAPRTQEFYQAKPANDLPFRASNFSMPMNMNGTRLTTAEVTPDTPVASGAVGHTPPQQSQGFQQYFPPPPKSVTR